MSHHFETLTRKELYKLVWSKPLVALSKKYNLSDNGLRKLCIRMSIPLPVSGHWVKLQFGKKVSITLLPSTEQELSRFEALYPPHTIKVNEESIDPFAIINGTRKRKAISFTVQPIDKQEQTELSMAARKQQGLSSDIMDRIKKNQEKNDQPDRPENS